MRAARASLRTVAVMLPDDLLRRITAEMRREPRWGFGGNRSRAVRVLLDEALTARQERRAAAHAKHEVLVETAE